MNRREMLTAFAGVAAAAGVAASVEAIEAEPQPILLVLKSDKPLSDIAMESLNLAVKAFREKHPTLPPIAVLQRGLTLEAVRPPSEMTESDFAAEMAKYVKDPKCRFEAE